MNLDQCTLVTTYRKPDGTDPTIEIDRLLCQQRPIALGHGALVRKQEDLFGKNSPRRN